MDDLFGGMDVRFIVYWLFVKNIFRHIHMTVRHV